MPVSPTGLEQNRNGELLAEKARNPYRAHDILQHTLAEFDALEIGDIRAQRIFGVGAAVDVVEQKAGQLASRRLAVVGSRQR